MTLETLWHSLTQHQNAWLMIVQVFLVVFLTLLLDFIQKRILLRIQRALTKKRNQWDDVLIEALRPPLSMLIWIVGIGFAAQMVGEQTAAVIFKAVLPLRDLGVIAMLTWFAVRFIGGMEQHYLERGHARGKPIDVTTADAVSKLLRVSAIITAALVALQTLGFDISGVLAFGGIGGIAVGFAAKDLLANFFGGLMIYLDRPFAVGDWIRSPDRPIEGTVEHIGWRLTVIRTFDKRLLYVPNATFSSIAVENPSRMSHRRIYETIGIRYDDAAAMEAIVADVRAMLQQHPEIDATQTLIVNFNAFAASSLDFFIYAFTKTTNWIHFHEVKQDVLLKVLDIVSRHGAEVAFPTSTVHLPDAVRIGPDGAGVPSGDG